MSPSRGVLLLAAALVTALLAACADTPVPPARPPGSAELLETNWRPVEIDGKPVSLQSGSLVLTKEGSRLRGNTGCNSMAGSYVLQGEALSFTRMAMTRRACLADGANELETAFLAALEATASYRIVAESLELRDKAGKLRMRLESRHLR
jgi:heat shock protein HslJ